MNFETRDLKRLRVIAQKHGYVLKTSKLRGKGSIKAMLEAVAGGELAVVRLVSANGDGA